RGDPEKRLRTLAAGAAGARCAASAGRQTLRRAVERGADRPAVVAGALHLARRRADPGRADPGLPRLLVGWVEPCDTHRWVSTLCVSTHPKVGFFLVVLEGFQAFALWRLAQLRAIEPPSH